MSLPSRFKWLAAGLSAVLLASVLLFACYGWLQEHDARLKAESTTVQQEKQIGNLKQQEQDTQQALAGKLSALEHERKQPATPSQFIADTATMLPDLPKPLEVRAVAEDPSLPDSPRVQEVMIPTEDLASVRDAEVSCRENSLKLNACESIQADLKQQVSLTEAQRNEWKTAAKGGSFWHRTMAAAKWFAIGVGSGAAAYAIAHHK